MGLYFQDLKQTALLGFFVCDFEEKAAALVLRERRGIGSTSCSSSMHRSRRYAQLLARKPCENRSELWSQEDNMHHLPAAYSY